MSNCWFVVFQLFPRQWEFRRYIGFVGLFPPHTHTLYFFHNGKVKYEEAGAGGRAKLDDLVTMRGPLRHTETKTSCQLANLHRLTFSTLASSWQEREWKQDASCTIRHTAVQFSTQMQRSNTVSSTLARSHSCTQVANGRCLPHNLRCRSTAKATRCYAWRPSNGNKTADPTNERHSGLSFAVLYLTVSLRPQSGGRG